MKIKISFNTKCILTSLCHVFFTIRQCGEGDFFHHIPICRMGFDTKPCRLDYNTSQVNSELWLQNDRKRKRQSGQSYTSKKGKVVKERRVLPVSCACHNKCGEQFTEEERGTVNAEYWKLADYAKQCRYLKSVVHISNCKRTLTSGDSRRSKTLKYTLNSKVVCKAFFLATLNLSSGAISVLTKKVSVGDCEDQRGRHSNHRKHT